MVFMAAVILACLSVGCASYSDLAKDDGYREIRSEVVQNARKKLGSGYRYASKGPNRFDCSGLVHYVYGRSGFNVPASSKALSRLGSNLNITDAKAGDLIFFSENNRVFHVSIITNNRKNELGVIHSTSSNGVIEQDILSSDYWRPKIFKIISLKDAIK